MLPSVIKAMDVFMNRFSMNDPTNTPAAELITEVVLISLDLL